MNACNCGSGIDYANCCEPILNGSSHAIIAEQLMRARYTAFTVHQVDFIYESTHPDHRDGFDREGTRAWAEQSSWQGLEIIGSSLGGENDNEGEVEFIARYKEKESNREHHERAQFRKCDNQWFFAESVMVKQQPLLVTKIGRNDPCLCGSGLKYKKCCGK
jgi:SEC-C motif domain protein